MELMARFPVRMMRSPQEMASPYLSLIGCSRVRACVGGRGGGMKVTTSAAGMGTTTGERRRRASPGTREVFGREACPGSSHCVDRFYDHAPREPWVAPSAPTSLMTQKQCCAVNPHQFTSEALCLECSCSCFDERFQAEVILADRCLPTLSRLVLSAQACSGKKRILSLGEQKAERWHTSRKPQGRIRKRKGGETLRELHLVAGGGVTEKKSLVVWRSSCVIGAMGRRGGVGTFLREMR